jgi:hypothetical protein
MEILSWIENWYQKNCDGYWEHSYSIKVETLDNPGWHISIDLGETNLENLNVDYQLIEHSENDWYGYSIKEKVFSASGDPSKLEFLLNKFREVVDGLDDVESQDGDKN